MMIQKLRLQRGWSQQQLADLSGLNVRTIQRIEGGHVASIESKNALAAAFNITVTDLEEPEMNQAEINHEYLAMRQVRKIRGFYIHLMQYIIIISALTAFNLIFTPHYYWFFFPMFGWGIGIIFHAIGTYNKSNLLFGAEWEKRKIEKILGRKL